MAINSQFGPGDVDRYVTGRMSDNEVEKFELFFLDRPEIAEEIALSKILMMGLKDIGQNTVPPSRESWWKRWFSLRRSPVWAGAFATMVFVVMAQSLYFTAKIDRLKAPQANTPVLFLTQARSQTDQGVVFLDDRIRWFALALELDWPQSTLYSLTVLDTRSGQSISHVDHLEVSNNDSVLVSLPAELFPQGSYDLVLRDQDAEVARYRINVVRQETH